MQCGKVDDNNNLIDARISSHFNWNFMFSRILCNFFSAELFNKKLALWGIFTLFLPVECASLIAFCNSNNNIGLRARCWFRGFFLFVCLFVKSINLQMRQLWHTRVWPFIDPLVNLLRLTDFYCASTFFRALVKKITLREYYGESLDSATAVLCYTFYLSYSALPLNEWLAVVWWQKAKVFCGFLFHFSHQLLMLFFATSYSPFCSFSLLSNFISTYLLLWLFFDILLFVVVVCLRYYANIKVFFVCCKHSNRQ